MITAIRVSFTLILLVVVSFHAHWSVALALALISLGYELQTVFNHEICDELNDHDTRLKRRRASDVAADSQTSLAEEMRRRG